MLILVFYLALLIELRLTVHAASLSIHDDSCHVARRCLWQYEGRSRHSGRLLGALDVWF